MVENWYELETGSPRGDSLQLKSGREREGGGRKEKRDIRR